MYHLKFCEKQTDLVISFWCIGSNHKNWANRPYIAICKGNNQEAIHLAKIYSSTVSPMTNLSMRSSYDLHEMAKWLWKNMQPHTEIKKDKIVTIWLDVPKFDQILDKFKK